MSLYNRMPFLLQPLLEYSPNGLPEYTSDISLRSITFFVQYFQTVFLMRQRCKKPQTSLVMPPTEANCICSRASCQSSNAVSLLWNYLHTPLGEASPFAFSFLYIDQLSVNFDIHILLYLCD